MIDFSLVIACYNDAPHLRANVTLLNQYLSNTNWRYEFIFVEDASRDNSAEVVRQCVSDLNALGVPNQAIFHKQNVGRGGTVSEGIMAAAGKIVGFIDIDLEHKMDGLVPMYELIQRGAADVLVGSRVIANPWAKPLRVVTSLTYRALIRRFIKLPVGDTEAGFKLFRRDAIIPVLSRTQNKAWFWDTEVLHRAHLAGLTLAEHPILFVENRTKKSTVRLLPDTLAYIAALRSHLKSLAGDKALTETSALKTGLEKTRIELSDQRELGRF